MNYKILVFDLDGTLTNSKKEITPYTKEVLDRYIEAGGIVVLASGRPTYGIWPVAKALELEKKGGYILSFNGGRILNCKTGEIIFDQILENDTLSYIRELAIQHQTVLLTYEDEYVITETADDIYLEKECKINNMKVKQVENLAEYVDFPVNKCLMTAHGNHLAEVEIKVREALGENYSVYRSEPFFLEIMPKNIDKAASLERLLEHLGKTREEMAAFGDGYNDKSMIEYAGLGVAMQNAQDAVKACADCVTLSNDEEGVAYMVNKLMEEESVRTC